MRSIARTQTVYLVQAYFASVLATCLILRSTKRFTSKIKDQSHANRNANFSPSMNDINFWWYVLRNMDQYATDDYSKYRKYFKNIYPSTIEALHKELSSASPDDWMEIYDHLRVISLRLDLRDSRTNSIRAAIHSWDYLDRNDKNQAINKCFRMLQEADPNSDLLNILRALSYAELAIIPGDTMGKFKSNGVVIKEDEGGLPMSGGGSPGDGVTSADDIAANPVNLMGGKVIRRRLKKWSPTKIKRKVAKIYRI